MQNAFILTVWGHFSVIGDSFMTSVDDKNTLLYISLCNLFPESHKWLPCLLSYACTIRFTQKVIMIVHDSVGANLSCGPVEYPETDQIVSPQSNFFYFLFWNVETKIKYTRSMETRSCHSDNLRCHQWPHGWYHYISRFLVPWVKKKGVFCCGPSGPREVWHWGAIFAWEEWEDFDVTELVGHLGN